MYVFKRYSISKTIVLEITPNTYMENLYRRVHKPISQIFNSTRYNGRSNRQTEFHQINPIYFTVIVISLDGHDFYLLNVKKFKIIFTYICPLVGNYNRVYLENVFSHINLISVVYFYIFIFHILASFI